MNQKRLVCLCNHVTELEIKKILRAGAISTADIQQFTCAGTGCGKCISEIEAIVQKYKSETAINPQQRLSFD